MTLWQLRYRSPMAPTKGVDDVVIETETSDYAEAKRLADWWLGHEMASPSTRFVYVRRLVVARTAEMEPQRPSVAAEAAEDLAESVRPNPVQAASRDVNLPPPPSPEDADMDAMAGAGSARGSKKHPGRIGA